MTFLFFVLFQLPNNENEWKKVSDEFASKWNFPHPVGSMDGKHVRIMKPPNRGSDYFNYKKFFSTVLFAVLGPHYEFLYVHTGTNGRIFAVSYTHLDVYKRQLV